MKTETTISLLAALEVINLIETHLEQSPQSDEPLLKEALDALLHGDRIIIDEGDI